MTLIPTVPPLTEQERAALNTAGLHAVRRSGEICDAYKALLPRLEAMERAFQVLAMYGVPEARAKSVANGIEVLMTRVRREQAAMEREREALMPALRFALHIHDLWANDKVSMGALEDAVYKEVITLRPALAALRAACEQKGEANV